LSLIGLIGGVTAFISDGLTNIWFLRSIALLAVVLVAFILRRAGQFVVASYVLVLELIGLVAGAFLQPEAVTGFIPYLFMPIIIIAGLILGPYEALILAIFSIVLVVIIIAIMGQPAPANLLTLLPPFVLTILTALVAILNGRYAVKVDNRLLESKKLLRERTLGLLNALEETRELQAQAQNLKEQLIRSSSEAGRAREAATRRDNQFYLLIKAAIAELKTSAKKLERMTETMVGVSNPLLPQVWQEIDHLSGLILSLDELAEMENEEIELEYQPVDLSQLLSELVETGRGLARNKNLDVRYLASDDLPPVKADPERLRQVLLHLISNAVKYTDQGLIGIQTQLTRNEIIIFVSDTGVGIPAEELETIFQSYSQGQSTPVRQTAGSGLGLCLSKRIIEKHSGRLWATSVVGVGSTFCIALPLEADLETTRLSLPALTLPSLTPANYETERATEVVSAVKTEAVPAMAALETVPSLPQSPAPDASLSQTQVNFSPVARFSPIYISRFGLTLLGLLLLITGLVLVLALTNGLNQGEAQIARATPAISPVNVTSNVAVPKTPTPVPTLVPTQVALSPTTSTPTQTEPAPTATATTRTVTNLPVQTTSLQETLPSSTPTTLATNTLVPTLTSSPTSLPTATPTTTPTQSPTVTPTSSPTPLPTATPTATATQPPTATPRPVGQAVAPTAIRPMSPPTSAFLSEPQGYPALSGLGFQSIPNTRLTAATDPAANSGLNWIRTPSGYQALFSADATGGDRELYLAPNGGSQLINLTQAAGDDMQPSVSPDSARIAFSSGRNGNLDIYVMDTSGGNPTRLTTSLGYDEWPAWSPDGRQIAFVSDRDGNVEIYTMNVDGSNQQRLTNHPADDWPAVWSPDGRTLLFGSNRDGNWNLYLLGLQNKSLTRLTDDPGDERNPAWSPDGRAIAFTYRNGDTWEIYTFSAPTSNPAAIPRSQWTQASTSSRNERYPTWLP
jgi:TolB protein